VKYAWRWVIAHKTTSYLKEGKEFKLVKNKKIWLVHITAAQGFSVDSIVPRWLFLGSQ
jgi:hypothetical protein